MSAESLTSGSTAIWVRKTFRLDHLPAEFAGDELTIRLTGGALTAGGLVPKNTVGGARSQHVGFDDAVLHITPADRFQYTGQEYDAETDLYYYGARYYDAGVGRFTTQDPLGTIDGGRSFHP
jgi:RHS repeat-associated protein